MALKKVKQKVNPKQVLKEKRSYCDSIHQDLQDQGVDFFSPCDNSGSLHIDKNYLSLPQNITEVSTRDLG